jgi:exopolysaccharide biosynthesis polyprenyl glycosylphosphotransferase
MNPRNLRIELPDQRRSQIHWHNGAAFFDKAAVMTDFFDLSAYPVRTLAQRTSNQPKLGHLSAPSVKVARPVPTGSTFTHHGRHAHINDTLPKHRFLKQLRLEKRRTDRSEAPLSIVLFRFDGENRDELGDVKGLLEIVHNTKRETDILGYLAEDLVALLLPDTNKQGTQAFTQKIHSRISALRFSMSSVIYPEQLFDYVLREPQDPVNAYPFFLGDPEPGQFADFCKRSVDIVGSLFALVVFSAPMLIIAAAVKMTSPGPVIFKQTRLGKRGVPFVFYKFRSMAVNADDRIHREYVASLISGDHEGINQGDSAKPLYKLKSDPRVTRIGRLIRKTSVDELPQLFNVLKGDMSLVGPRPPILYEAEKYEPWHLRRILEMKPGITGIWQVEGRSKTSFDEMVRMDLRYMRHCSLLFDLKILFKTVMVVLKREGAT